MTDALPILVPLDERLDLRALRWAQQLAATTGNQIRVVSVVAHPDRTGERHRAIKDAIEDEDVEIAVMLHDDVAGAVVDGPFALDIAVSPEAADIKGVASPVAGQADLLIVPNIEAGNAVYKAMVYYMSATAAGLVMGAKVPIMLTSRADPPEARLTAAALAAIAAAREPD